MKKLLSLLLSGALLLGAAGCSNSGGSGSGGSDGEIKVGVLLSGPPTDGGYCQQGADGVRAIQEKYGLDDSQVSIIDSVTTAETARQEAEAMANDGYTVIFGQGGEFASYFEEIAQDYPDTWFVTNGGDVVGENQFPMCMSTEEGGYVCGVIAGMMTQSNQLGTIAGSDYPSFTKPNVGFALGAKSVNPDVSVTQVVLSSMNTNEAYETAMSQIQAGADFIFPNANEGNTGAIKAVDETDGAYTFGVFGDYNSASPTKVVGTMQPDTNAAYVAVFDAIMNGEAKGEIMYLGMAEGIVNFTWNEEVKATMPEDVVTAVDDTIEQIKAGEIDIPNEYEIGETGYEMYFA